MQKKQDIGTIIVIYGGSGSGKSQVAENLSEKLYHQRKKEVLYYIATMIPYGEESQKKIERHRRQRQEKHFVVKEIYYDIGEEKDTFRNAMLLLDCLSNLVANEWYRFISNMKVMGQEDVKKAKEKISQKIVKELDRLKRQNCDLIVVTNDIFRSVRTHWEGEEDYLSCLGLVNQKLMEQSDCIYQIMAEEGICINNNIESKQEFSNWSDNIYEIMGKKSIHQKNKMEVSINLSNRMDCVTDNVNSLIPVDRNSFCMKEKWKCDRIQEKNMNKTMIDALNERTIIENKKVKKAKENLETRIKNIDDKLELMQEYEGGRKKKIYGKKEKILVVGGEFQGKQDWSKKHWPIRNEINMIDSEQNCNGSSDIEKCGYNLYFYIDQWILLKVEEHSIFLSDKIEMEQKLYKLWELFECEFQIEEHSIFLMNEIGCGIVPLEKKDRIYRELSGRFMCQLAKKVEQLYQIVAGYEIRLK